MVIDDEDQRRIDIDDEALAEAVRQAVRETPRGRAAILDQLNRKLRRHGLQLCNVTAHRYG
jgi:CRISPR/Cas system-associated protein Csm6